MNGFIIITHKKPIQLLHGSPPPPSPPPVIFYLGGRSPRFHPSRGRLAWELQFSPEGPGWWECGVHEDGCLAHMVCVRKVVNYSGRLFKMHSEMSRWCSEQYFRFFSLRCCVVSVPHEVFQRSFVWWSRFCTSTHLYPSLTVLCFLLCGN